MVARHIWDVEGPFKSDIFDHYWDVAKLVKAQDFDSCIRLFESDHPSHPVGFAINEAFERMFVH